MKKEVIYSSGNYLRGEFTIEGYRFSKGWSPRHKIFFAIKSNVPVDQLAVFDNDQPVEEEEGYGLIKGVARFEKAPSNVVWKIGISSVSCAKSGCRDAVFRF